MDYMEYSAIKVAIEPIVAGFNIIGIPILIAGVLFRIIWNAIEGKAEKLKTVVLRAVFIVIMMAVGMDLFAYLMFLGCKALGETVSINTLIALQSDSVQLSDVMDANEFDIWHFYYADVVWRGLSYVLAMIVNLARFFLELLFTGPLLGTIWALGYFIMPLTIWPIGIPIYSWFVEMLAVPLSILVGGLPVAIFYQLATEPRHRHLTELIKYMKEVNNPEMTIEEAIRQMQQLEKYANIAENFSFFDVILSTIGFGILAIIFAFIAYPFARGLVRGFAGQVNPATATAGAAAKLL